MIAIVDYGVGNLFSLKSSFAAIGQEAVVTGEAEVLQRAERILLPGVGAFGDAADKLRASGLDRVVVDDRELRRGGVSYAVDTVSEIARENPGAEIVFLVGEDSVAGLPRWKDYDRLRTLCTFRSFPRTRESSTEVRRRLAAGEPVDDLVPPAVAAELSAAVPGRG